jgi:hypothetical protein
MGWLGGHAWAAGAWPGVLGFLGLLWLGCAGLALRLARLPVPAHAAAREIDTASRP